MLCEGRRRGVGGSERRTGGPDRSEARGVNAREVANWSPRGGELVAPGWRTGRPEVANWSPRGDELVALRWRT